MLVAQVPQRFITVNDLSPLDAAVRLLTFGAFIPIGGVVAAAFMKKGVPPMWLVLVGAIMEIIGIVLLSRIGTTEAIDNGQYGYQFLAGLGTGIINSSLIILVPYIMEKRDLGKSTPSINADTLLTSPSRWLGGDFAVPNPRWPRRHRHRGVGIHALHQVQPYRHRGAEDRIDASREDGDREDIGARSRSERSQSLRKGIQPPSEDFDWFCCREIAGHSDDVDECQVGVSSYRIVSFYRHILSHTEYWWFLQLNVRVLQPRWRGERLSQSPSDHVAQASCSGYARRGVTLSKQQRRSFSLRLPANARNSPWCSSFRRPFSRRLCSLACYNLQTTLTLGNG